jgi:Glycosyl transferase family 2
MSVARKSARPNFDSKSLVTGVITSCNRHALLDRTLDSFFAMNSYPLRQLIVVEDGETIAEQLKEKYGAQEIVWISTGRRVGQIAAIDYAYSHVRPPYIFHMEDDWEFYRSRFIEASLTVLERRRKCLQVWLRALNDTNGHPVGPRIHITGGVRWRRLAFNYGEWHGFSFNPGLRRLSDYVILGGYGSCSQFNFEYPRRSESAISQWYRDRGYYAAILCDDKGRGFVRHIGDYDHVGRPSDYASTSMGAAK